MATDFNETHEIMLTVLETQSLDPTIVLHNFLTSIDRTAPEFYDGVLEHGERMNFTAANGLSFIVKFGTGACCKKNLL